MARPVIGLLTDFGTKDHYAGTMKGVALGICPEAACVDITHEIPPHDILAGALELAASYKYFPPATVFLVVVALSVGSVSVVVPLSSVAPIFVLALSFFFLRGIEVLTVRIVAGTLLIVAGVAVLTALAGR